jgi:uncharacterized protein YjiS (DUF1127 family)
MSVHFANLEIFSSGRYGVDGHDDQPLLARLFARIGSTFLKWAERVRESSERRRTLAELAALSDYELADIGLSRADLPRLFDPEFVRERLALREAYAPRQPRA